MRYKLTNNNIPIFVFFYYVSQILYLKNKVKFIHGTLHGCQSTITLAIYEILFFIFLKNIIISSMFLIFTFQTKI